MKHLPIKATVCIWQMHYTRNKEVLTISFRELYYKRIILELQLTHSETQKFSTIPNDISQIKNRNMLFVKQCTSCKTRDHTQCVCVRACVCVPMCVWPCPCACARMRVLVRVWVLACVRVCYSQIIQTSKLYITKEHRTEYKIFKLKYKAKYTEEIIKEKKIQ